MDEARWAVRREASRLGPTVRELADTDTMGGSCEGAGRDDLAFYVCLWLWNE